MEPKEDSSPMEKKEDGSLFDISRLVGSTADSSNQWRRNLYRNLSYVFAVYYMAHGLRILWGAPLELDFDLGFDVAKCVLGCFGLVTLLCKLYTGVISYAFVIYVVCVLAISFSVYDMFMHGSKNARDTCANHPQFHYQENKLINCTRLVLAGRWIGIVFSGIIAMACVSVTTKYVRWAKITGTSNQVFPTEIVEE